MKDFEFTTKEVLSDLIGGGEEDWKFDFGALLTYNTELKLGKFAYALSQHKFHAPQDEIQKWAIEYIEEILQDLKSGQIVMGQPKQVDYLPGRNPGANH